jgi:DDE superfamily endonuclease
MRDYMLWHSCALVNYSYPTNADYRTFHISRATIKPYLKPRRETGQVQPHVIPGRTPKKGGALRAKVEELLHERTELAPHLSAGQIVVMDNLRCHKSEKVRLAIEARGCRVLFLPGYSPDLSPVEETFSKLKTFLRRVSARTPEALEEAICQALLTITTQDARG